MTQKAIDKLAKFAAEGYIAQLNDPDYAKKFAGKADAERVAYNLLRTAHH